ncbi:hypothetical protein AV530_001167 [Patagioenas fasciata monilis]|uniref:Secreted protein n=1 Tax=Patagioenas fasciata monilis TaxID=372326 RepID=A0A1V4KTG6_PATFA|nr:hypothetical protein AV530_001167 [Patagioenas fasciata monilis]
MEFLWFTWILWLLTKGLCGPGINFKTAIDPSGSAEAENTCSAPQRCRGQSWQTLGWNGSNVDEETTKVFLSSASGRQQTHGNREDRPGEDLTRMRGCSFCSRKGE